MNFFNEIESSRLEAARKAVNPKTATIVYTTWENPFAKGGGIIAVATNYGAELVRQGRDVVMLTPFHTFLSSAPEIGVQVKQIANGTIAYGESQIEFSLYEHVDVNRTRWVLVKAPPFFEGGAGQADPYQPYESLLDESLFFCNAIPAALAELGLKRNTIIHLQDWQTAGAALTVKEAILNGVLETSACVLTMHNPYDRSLEAESLSKLSSRAPSTVYQLMLPLMDGPTSTVSATFAKELTSDPLQTGCFASHLQTLLKAESVEGVDNGLFGKAKNAYPEGADEAGLLEIKHAKRSAMLNILGKLEDRRIIGSLDFERLLSKPEIPIFMMFGRLDPGQKGFDVLAGAIEQVCEQRIEARFILAPAVIDPDSPFAKDAGTRKQLEGVAQLGLLAHKLPEKVVVYPYRLSTGYMEAMAGSSFAIFPSLYEPFGGATEPYLCGTPVIARSTGGLKQQVVEGETGFLYRENLDASHEQIEEEWRQLQALGPSERTQLALHREMVAGLSGCLKKACEFYRSEPKRYAKMLSNLFAKACEFSWEKTAAEYQKIYDQACSG